METLGPRKVASARTMYTSMKEPKAFCCANKWKKMIIQKERNYTLYTILEI